MIKKRIIFCLILMLSSFIIKAQEISAFTPDTSKYLTELRAFFQEEMDGSKKQAMKDLIGRFSGEWLFGNFTEQQRAQVYLTSNLFLQNKLGAYPFFYDYIRLVLNITRQNLPAATYDSIHSSVRRYLEEGSKKFLGKYLRNLNDIIEGHYLYSAPDNSWKFTGGEYTFEYDTIPRFLLKKINIKGYASRDSIEIFGTSGILYPTLDRWQGQGGLVTWERAGFSRDTVFARLDLYNISLKSTFYDADSVTFYNLSYFSRPLSGKLEDRVMANTTINNATYPRFTSYLARLQIRNIFTNIDYDGGFTMEGNRIRGTGDQWRKAELIIKRNGEPFMILASQSFLIGIDRISSLSASMTLYKEADSIFHPDVQMRYIDDWKELTLLRGDEGMNQSPFFNTYHELDMFPETMNWKINTNIIDFEKIKGISTIGKALFESSDLYTGFRFERIAGLNETHPLVAIKNLVRNNPSKRFYTYELAEYMKKSEDQVRAQLISLASKGFLTYDEQLDQFTVTNRLYHYTDAKNGLADYDVISFRSEVEDGSNAILDLNTFNLLIRGVPKVFLSDSQNVIITPHNKEVLITKNRDFFFSGKVNAGLLEFYAHECFFDYDTFKLNMPNIDYLTIYLELKKPDQKGKTFVPMKSVIRDLSGTLWIDHPNNKSGLNPYPKYPYFVSKNESYVYYNDTAIEHGVYHKEDFYYEVSPFTFDSLNTFSTAGLAFDGKLVSGIFPDIDEPVKVQEDLSLGFKTLTPDAGLPAYDGRGVFSDTIELSNKGLRGSGKLNYLTSLSYSNDFAFYPGKVNAKVRSFELPPLYADKEYPEVHAENASMTWLPFADSMMVTSDSKYPIDMFDQMAQIEGTLVLTPEILKGKGKVSLEDAGISSGDFTFKHHEIFADRSDFKLKVSGTDDLALSTHDYSTHIDLSLRTGEFFSVGDRSKIEFPFNQYICMMDELKWTMDDKKISLSNSVPPSIPNLETLSYPELIDVDFSGSEFVSVHPGQESLSFFALQATYDLNEYVINADGVRIIKVADAAIFPADEKITIRQDAKMDSLTMATIIANRETKYHAIYNSDVSIQSKNNYTAKGFYDYIDEYGGIQPIFLKSITTTPQHTTTGVATVSDSLGFALSAYFLFRGDIQLNAERQFLSFKGGYQALQDCELPLSAWVKFNSEVDPENIILPVNEDLKDLDNNKISDGLLFSSGQYIFPAFFTKKENYNDIEIASASGNILYDKKAEEFRIGSLEKIRGETIAGNMIKLGNRNCSYYGEGIINTGLDYRGIDMSTPGYVTHYIIPDSTVLDIALILDFYFSEEVLGILYRSLYMANLPGIDLTSGKYTKVLAESINQQQAQDVISEINSLGTIRRIPPELEHTLFFSDVKLVWNPVRRSFISSGPIGIGSILDNPVNKYVNGIIEFNKRRSGDILNIYFKIDDKEWYFFSYVNYKMKSVSSNDEYNSTLANIKEKKRKLKDREDRNTYMYTVGSRNDPGSFLRNIESATGY